jgi:hypothetical protein
MPPHRAEGGAHPVKLDLGFSFFKHLSPGYRLQWKIAAQRFAPPGTPISLGKLTFCTHLTFGTTPRRSPCVKPWPCLCPRPWPRTIHCKKLPAISPRRAVAEDTAPAIAVERCHSTAFRPARVILVGFPHRICQYSGAFRRFAGARSNPIPLRPQSCPWDAETWGTPLQLPAYAPA